MTSVTFIGGGNMARGLIGGLVADGWPPSDICVADPSPEQRLSLTGSWPGLRVTDDNVEAVAGAGVVVLAVKPQQIAGVAREVAAAVTARRPLVVSIAAGVRAPDLDRWLGGGLPVVRCMPNTPSLVGAGATALFATAAVSAEQRSLAESIMRAVGLTVWLDDEELIDAVTALSGSGPAYFFLVIEALEEAGHALGLPHDTARLLAIQTAFGAAKLALESDEEPAELRRRVTSPGGTTERALAVLEEGALRKSFAAALTAARDRGRELAAQLGDE